MLQFRVKPRRFICKRCGNKSQDEGTRDQEKLQKDVEFEFMDLCPKCFKDFRKQNIQAHILVELVQQGKVTQQEIVHMNDIQVKLGHKEFTKYKVSLLRRYEFKEGWAKEKRKLLIQNLHLKMQEVKNRLNYIKSFGDISE